MTTLQQANSAYVDIECGERFDHIAQPIDTRPDAEIILDRFFLFPHGEQSWLDLTTCWIPFIQTGPRDRKFWSKRRVAKAIDTLVDAGLIEDTDGSDCNWRITKVGTEHFDGNGRKS